MITAATLRRMASRANAVLLDPLAAAMTEHLPAYAIDTALRAAHFLAQAAHETDGFRTLEEYASGAAYEGREDLGNTVAGDGRRFKGRGIFQLTGRANYEAMGRKLGLDLIADPSLAASPALSVRIACEYWATRRINAPADRDDLEAVTRKINGGLRGLADRRTYLERVKPLLV